MSAIRFEPRQGPHESGLPAAEEMIDICLIEPRTAYRQALAFVLDREPDLSVIADGRQVTEAGERCADASIVVLGSGDPTPEFRLQSQAITRREADGMSAISQSAGIDELLLSVRQIAGREQDHGVETA